MSEPRRLRVLLALPILALSLAPLAAVAADSDWPQWRGPTGNGVSLDGRPPVEWGESKNVKWKVAVPGSGSATPIVWRDKIFLATAIPAGGDAAAGSGREQASPRGRGGRGRGGRGRGSAPITAQKFTVLCLDRATGKTLWSRTAVEATPHQGHHATHGFASASPITDGEHVWAYFGSRGLFCYDIAGKEIWKKTDFGKMDTRNGFGEGNSPTLHGNAIIVPWDHEGPSYLVALGKKTGDVIWKTDRDEPTCWATPLVVEHGGKKQVIVSGQNYARGYDFNSGKEIWRCGGQTQRPVASPVFGHDLVFIGSGFRGSYLGAFRLDRKGDLEGTDGVAWSIDEHTPDVPSLLLSGRRLYFFAARRGILSCVDAVTKEPYYSTVRLDDIREVYASPVAANGKVYLTSRDGVTVVIEDADEFKIVATNRLDEGVDATPAIAGEEIFLRGQKHLYCFRAR